MRKELSILNGKAGSKPKRKDSYYQNLINKHLVFIEKQCFKAVRASNRDNLTIDQVNVENEALELSNRVLDLLQVDNYKILREFRGNSRITTYFSAIISRQAVDLIRKKLGRSRQKERAKQLGNIGLLVYERVIKDGFSIAEVLKELPLQSNPAYSAEDLRTILQKIKGKDKIQPAGNHSVVRNGKVTDNEEVIIADFNHDPQRVVLDQDRNEKINQVIGDIISKLSGEECLILRMRYPVIEGEDPKSVKEISEILGINQKAVYKRVSRILNKCRDRLDQNGVRFDDIF